MNNIRIAIYTTIILLLCTYVSFAGEAKPNFKVNLGIACDNEEIKQKAESYLSRELRSLGDVTIVDENYADCAINVIIINISNVGFAISVVCKIPILPLHLTLMEAGTKMLLNAYESHPQLIGKGKFWQEELKIEEKSRHEEIMQQMTALNSSLKSLSDMRISLLPTHSLYAGEPYDLRRICEEIIVHFDNDYLKENTYLKKNL